MPVQRTPPHRVNQRPPPSPRPTEVDMTLPPTSRAFQTSNPGVRRTPPPGTEPPPSSAMTPQPNLLVPSDMRPIIENDSSVGIPPAHIQSSTPPPAEPVSQAQKTPSPLTPIRKPPQSTKKTPAQVLDEPAVPVPIEAGATEDWGKRYEITLDTLELAVRAGTQKWTVKNIEQSFPTLAGSHKSAIEAVYISSAQKMRHKIMEEALGLFEHYKVGPALQAIDQVVLDARSKASSAGRPDAWRPNMSPYVLMAATNLPMYDEAYARLRAEYLELHDDCRSRFASVRAKQNALAEMETSVSDGVIELMKTIELLEGVPSEEMMQWMEDTVGKLEGARAP
ncbi:MAG: hypothetical protein TREMPRED_000679 [Tremellales sp. Tagirdzhanova-0007]|nr:MAG: hypothetical protein TREMPRED_000679 [Tremellales sp. Tagirdzhanova-0007]